MEWSLEGEGKRNIENEGERRIEIKRRRKKERDEEKIDG